MPDNGRRSYDTGASSEVQANISGIMARLEAIIGQRKSDVSSALGDWYAEGVSDAYQGKENKWEAFGEDVRALITSVRTTMENNDGHAANAQGKAQGAVDNIAV